MGIFNGGRLTPLFISTALSDLEPDRFEFSEPGLVFSSLPRLALAGRTANDEIPFANDMPLRRKLIEDGSQFMPLATLGRFAGRFVQQLAVTPERDLPMLRIRSARREPVPDDVAGGTEVGGDQISRVSCSAG